MARSARTIYIEDLIRSKIVAADGTELGRVVDLEIEPGHEYRVTALVFGAVSWLYRLNVLEALASHLGKRLQPRKVRWQDVDRWEPFTVILRADAQFETLNETRQ